LAFGGTVTTNGANTITVPAACAALAGGGSTGIPALSEWAMAMLAALLATAGFAAMRGRAR
ncbi:MAG TPA: IPTL-CTERM sorting domain-containing protein, partial [Usitatibacter sp.]